MTGILITNHDTFIFRDDHGHDPGIWAWNIHDIPQGGRVMTHKWDTIPKGIIIDFDIDNPPNTVSYIPILGDL